MVASSKIDTANIACPSTPRVDAATLANDLFSGTVNAAPQKKAPLATAQPPQQQQGQTWDTTGGTYGIGTGPRFS